MAQEAVRKALSDAKLSYNVVDQACVGYVYGTFVYNSNLKFCYFHGIDLNFTDLNFRRLHVRPESFVRGWTHRNSNF